MFKISETPLEGIDLRQGLLSSSAGAFNCFEGFVRDHNNGKKVLALEYQVYQPLCEKEAQKIFSEVQEKFDVIAAKCFHREGKLNIGDMTVWVGCCAKHRGDSFGACRYIIDEIKARLAIWKKEYYENGDSGWIGCESCTSQETTLTNPPHIHAK